MAITKTQHAGIVNTAIVLWMIKTYILHVNAVSWFIKTRPVEYGKSVELFCNTPEICNDCNKQWHRESDRRLLTFDGAPTNPSKYTSIIHHNGFNLIIKNFSSNDANETFICTHGFKSYRKQLNKDENFEYYSLDNATKIEDKERNRLYMPIEFDDVHPTFNCSILSTQDDASINSLKRNKTSELLSVHVALTSKDDVSKTLRKKLMRMRCFIEFFKLDVIMEDQRPICNHGKHTQVQADRGILIICLITVVVLLLCALFGLLYKDYRSKIYIHCCLKKNRQCKCEESEAKLAKIGGCEFSAEQEQTFLSPT